jgi:chromate transporter
VVEINTDFIKKTDAKENVVIGLKFLFFTLLKIGSVSWGGFMALISVVQKEFTEKNKLIDNETILDGIALASVLPGPMAFNVVTYVGYKLKGLKGAFVSMIAILLPSFVLMIFLSWLYFTYGQVPVLNSFFKGVLPAIAAIVLSVAFNMSEKSIQDPVQGLIAATAVIVLLFIQSFYITLLVMLSSAILGYLVYRNQSTGNTILPSGKKMSGKLYLRLGIILLIFILIIAGLPVFCPDSLKEVCLLQQKIAYIFSGLSLTLFGGGYVIIPILENTFVTHLGWLTTKEFADGIALGQVTPGPIFISAAFIGYKMSGFTGALTATISVFLPPAILMVAFSEIIDKIKNSTGITAAFKGLRPAVIGMIISAVVTIGKNAEINWISLAIFLIVILLSVKYKLNVVFLIPLAGILGILLY